MPTFSQTSIDRLATCHPNLRKVFAAVIMHVDCTILCGHRGKAEQQRAYLEGNSKLQWPNSKHNGTPSLAVDVAPYPIDWRAFARFHRFAGFVLGVASQLGVKLRNGGDWDRDFDLKDQKFNDVMHFELIAPVGGGNGGKRKTKDKR